MAREYASKLEKLSAKHDDILVVVDRMFQKFSTMQQVQDKIKRDYDEEVGLTAISTYKHKRFDVFRDMVRRQKADILSVAEIIGEDGLGMAVNALLWQELQGMTPTQLVAFLKVMNDTEKVTVLKKQFALLAQEHREKMKQRKATGEKGCTHDATEEYAKAQRVVAQVKEMFGIGMSAGEPPQPKLLGSGQSTTSMDVAPDRAVEQPQPDAPAAGNESE